MTAKDHEALAAYVEQFWHDLKKSSTINGVTFSYYKSLRGYFKHSNLLTDIKQKEFKLVDFLIWERMLTHVKPSHSPVESGGLFFRYQPYQDLCGESAFYKSKKKFIELGLLLKTPFPFYFILNPLYVIKIYNPSPYIYEEPPTE